MKPSGSAQSKPRILLWFIIFLAISSVIVNILSINPNLKFRKGLDLEGGTSITFRANMSDIPVAQRDNALESAKEVIERRINIFGVSEPVIQTAKGEGDYRIIIELPGITNLNEAVELVGKTAKLEFREVKEATTSAVLYENTLSTGLTGADLKDAQASFDPTSGAPVVLFRIADNSQTKFFETTQRLRGKQMAIFLDNNFISAPVVQEGIRDSGQITGNFTIEGTKEFATLLNAGALPVPLSTLQTQVIGPTLGLDSLKKSLFAGALGFLTIVVFMIGLYGKLGILASFALLLYGLLLLAIFKVSSLTPYGITLTLSGIAGFILSIGMAVDANILTFERMKEELRLGKSREIAVELGFQRAWTSIRDSNISSLITSFILYQFGTGAVRGFALVLALGILVSMFSAIIVTRTLIRNFYK
jgi:preprotein translocase subunit SecD